MENSLHCKYEKNKIKIEHENIARVRKCLFVLYYRYKKDKWKRGRGKREVEKEEGEKRRGKREGEKGELGIPYGNQKMCTVTNIFY